MNNVKETLSQRGTMEVTSMSYPRLRCSRRLTEESGDWERDRGNFCREWFETTQRQNECACSADL